MERQANYALVGAIGLFLLFATVVFVVWLANVRFDQSYDRYRIVFRGPVSGLSKGGEVQFNGLKVGEITRIAFDPDDANRILTELEVNHGTPIRADSVAQPFTKGITGVKYVQISPGSPQQPLLRSRNGNDPPVIMAKRGRMEDFVEDLSKLATGGTETVQRINRVLSDANIANVSEALRDVRELAGALKGRKAMFARLDSALTKLDGAATDLQATMAAARQSLGEDGAFSDIDDAAGDLRLAVANFNSALGRVDGLVTDLSTTTVPRVTFAAGAVQQAADRLDNLAFRIEQNPGMLLDNQPDRQMKIPR